MGLFDTFRMTCRDVTFLHEKKKEGKLSFSEALGLKIHLLYCGLCRLFFKQMDDLEKQTSDLCKTEKVISTLDTSTKEKMQQALIDEMKKP